MIGPAPFRVDGQAPAPRSPVHARQFSSSAQTVIDRPTDQIFEQRGIFYLRYDAGLNSNGCHLQITSRGNRDHIPPIENSTVSDACRPSTSAIFCGRTAAGRITENIFMAIPTDWSASIFQFFDPTFKPFKELCYMRVIHALFAGSAARLHHRRQ